MQFRHCPATVIRNSGVVGAPGTRKRPYICRGYGRPVRTHVCPQRSCGPLEGERVLTKSLVAAAAAGGVLLSATPALAADGGLYGKGDPTYDGVYRQSLSILALEATGRAVPKRALKWLKR